jgi:hypothetical protein
MAIAKLKANWKTTAIGLLILLMSAAHSINFDASGRLAMTQKDWVTILLGLLAAVVGYLQTDAGATTVRTPQGDVETAASHEIPDDPANQPLPKG